MVWVVEKKVFYHFLDMGFESVEIPIRVKFEFEVKEGRVVPDSISKAMLYNQQALERCYPNLDPQRLQRSIEDKVDAEIHKYLRGCGYLRDEPL
jgi:hypothetical protein